MFTTAWWTNPYLAVLKDLGQLVQHPILTSDRHGNPSNILDLFLISYPSVYAAERLSPLGSFSHNVISVSCLIVRSKPLGLWHYGTADWEDLRQYFHDFPCNDFSKLITEVIFSGMKLEAYKLHSFSHFNNS